MRTVRPNLRAQGLPHCSGYDKSQLPVTVALASSALLLFLVALGMKLNALQPSLSCACTCVCSFVHAIHLPTYRPTKHLPTCLPIFLLSLL